ncbi:MAG: hypothetical protein J0L58_20800, partial [Burkholderiales bacterium]|nr:hypothetical protein [Burkholderiales bacterium]
HSDPRWPTGALGDTACRLEAQPLHEHAALLHAWQNAPVAQPAPAALPLQLQGQACLLRLDGLRLRLLNGRPTLLLPRYVRAKAADHLQAWAVHLALQAALGPEAQALGAARGALLRFAPVQSTLTRLQGLAELAFGWSAEPPPLPIKSAWALVREGESAARKAWSGGDWPERSDATWALLTRGGAEPLEDPRFAELAAQVFEPLLEHAR